MTLVGPRGAGSHPRKRAGGRATHPAPMSSLEGFPEDLARVDVDGSRAILDIDAGLYPLEAVYGAAYVFFDRCYVLLDRPAPTKLRIVIAPKKPDGGAEQLR